MSIYASFHELDCTQLLLSRSFTDHSNLPKRYNVSQSSIHTKLLSGNGLVQESIISDPNLRQTNPTKNYECRTKINSSHVTFHDEMRRRPTRLTLVIMCALLVNLYFVLFPKKR